MIDISKRLHVKNASVTTVSELNEDFELKSGCFGIIYVLYGCLEIIVSDSMYSLERNCLTVISPTEISNIQNRANTGFIYIKFDAENMPEQLTGIALNCSSLEKELIDEITLSDQEMLENNTIHDQRVCCLTELLLLGCFTKEKLAPTPVSDDFNIYKKALDILKRRLSSQISVDDLANVLNVSLSHIKRIFNRFAGMGVHEYYTHLKIEYAKELLLQGISVTETAKLTGFSNQAYFSAAFKRTAHFTPKEFSSNHTVIKGTKQHKNKKSKSASQLPDYLL